MTQDSSGNRAFVTAQQRTRDLIARFNKTKECSFLTSSNYMHAETAKLSYLLSAKFKTEASGGASRTFYVNSGLEALSGAIKLARQTSVRRKRADQGWVLFLDETETYWPFFDSLRRGPERALTPHIEFHRDLADALTVVGERLWSAVVIIRSSDLPDETKLSALADRCRETGAMVIVSNCEMDLNSPRFFDFALMPDVVVCGESLTDRQLPFGCFTMSALAQSVWNNNVDCFAQTSTFGGNKLCAASALAALSNHGLVSAEQRAMFQAIDSEFPTMLAKWGEYTNPGMAALAPIFGMDMNVAQAYGGRLLLANGREVIDCSGGFGCNLRGHNPPDIPKLMEVHEPMHDYFGDLEQLLTKITKFPHAFPAVSGATAVDVAANIGMLANPTREIVVTFTGNFSGKTLFSLNFSKFGPQLTESDSDAFRPYYPFLVYIDPFSADAETRLRSVLELGNVALVWFEVLRGGMCEALPVSLLSLIDELKTQYGYLVGVDEVLSGGWRSGENYLAHTGLLRGVDIVTIGKTLSDMTTPMSAVLVTEAVYQSALKTFPEHVFRLENHYRNNLTSHICLNALVSALAESQSVARSNYRQIIETGLRELAVESPLFSNVNGRGTLLLLVMNHKHFPFHHRSKLGNLLEMSLSHLIFERCGVFAFLLRFLHRVHTDEVDALEIVSRLRVGLTGVTPFMVYRYALSRILSPKLPRLSRWVGGSIAIPPQTLMPGTGASFDGGQVSA